jgi:hypothetical protein
MRSHAVAPHRSLAFAILGLSVSLAVADPAASPQEGVSVTGHALPPHEVGTPLEPPTHPWTLTRPAASEGRSRFNPVDRTLATTYLVFSGLDAWQTGNLPPGYREGNPLVSSWAGDQPELGHAVAFKTVMSLGALGLVKRLERPAHRRAVLILINLVQASVVVMNERKTGGILFPN